MTAMSEKAALWLDSMEYPHVDFSTTVLENTVGLPLEELLV